MSVFFAIALFVLSALASLIATGAVLGVLKKRAILDIPNDRSSHTVPTPRGGGIGILLVCLPVLSIIPFWTESAIPAFGIVLAAAFALALTSWVDDLKTLGPLVRFISQIGAVSLCLIFMPTPENGYLGGFLPVWAEKILLGLGWVWFINLFNFMDGIDGISATEIISLSVGIILIAVLASLPDVFIASGLVLGGAALGFLRWNWHKAKVFMGDVGSVPLGFIFGWLLISLAGEGYFIPALIIALYYLADATLTLIKRAFQKKKVWQAHREHFYQMATQAGMAHDKVVLKIATLNAFLLGCCALSLLYSNLLGLLLAGLGVLVCLRHFYQQQ